MKKLTWGQISHISEEPRTINIRTSGGQELHLIPPAFVDLADFSQNECVICYYLKGENPGSLNQALAIYHDDITKDDFMNLYIQISKLCANID